MKNPLVLGSRDSELALAQSRQVMDTLKAQYPHLTLELKTYKTQGDLILDGALSEIGDKGLFVKELEMALFSGEIDVAVHSMKDMPSDLPPGLKLVPFGKRESPVDVLVSKSGHSFWDLPTGSVIGTSSLRRQAVLKGTRSDLVYQTIRGNILTRLRKLEEGPYDALVLAAAGLHRLSLDACITHSFLPSYLVPACCQGTLALELADANLMALFEPLADEATQIASVAERQFLRTMQGGCQIPLAAFARPLDERHYLLHAFISDADGQTLLRTETTFMPKHAAAVGEKIAQELLAQGGEAILHQILHA